MDARARKNMDKVASDLTNIHQVMSKSLSDVLERGERLDRVASRSASLLDDSKRYKKLATKLNQGMWWRKYGLFVIMGGVVAMVLLARWYFF